MIDISIVQEHRICIGMELVTAALEDQGQRPLHDYGTSNLLLESVHKVTSDYYHSALVGDGVRLSHDERVVGKDTIFY